MLIGAHVSPAGGPAKAVERGADIGAEAIQIFNQNPRAWKARDYTDEEVAAYHASREEHGMGALLIHAVYLLNCASEDPEIRDKSLASLIIALRAGAALGAQGVVLHAGSAKSGEVGPAIARAGAVIAEALAETERCPLHLENTAGAGGTLGRSFHELAALMEAAGGDERLGLCLDSCHLFASGFDIRTTEGMESMLDECVELVGLERLGSLHLNDSQTGLGSNRDRHANVGEGELGDEGCAVFLSELRFDGLPCVLETGPSTEVLTHCRELLARGRRSHGTAQRSPRA
jgi:deoxyribonuclease-4